MTSRTRIRGSFDGGTQKYVTTTFAGSQVTADLGPYAGLSVGEQQTTTDVVTPNFRTRIERGEIINNPFTSWTVNKSESFSGHTIVKNTGSGSTIRTYDWEKGYSIPGVRTDWWVDIARQQVEASTEAAAGVEDTTVEGATELAEGRQTIDLFNLRQYRLREQILRELRYAQKRGSKFPVSVPAAVMANNWLLYRFGLGPACQLAMDTLIVGSRIRTRRETSRGFASTGGTDSVVQPTVIGGFHDVQHTVTKTWQSSVRAGILYEYWRSFGNKYGVTLGRLPGAAWEYLPWSFVADWFTNTGVFINALVPRVQTVRRATWLGYHTEIFLASYSSLSGIKGSGYSVTKSQSGATVHKIEGRKRSPHVLAPSWYIRENAMSDVIHSARVVDAFALTTQLLFKLMRRS